MQEDLRYYRAMKNIVLSLLLLSMLRAGPCQIDLSCSFYTACLAKHCPCQNGEEDYAITYGYKYCQRFLHPTIALSPQGMAGQHLALLAKGDRGTS